MKKKILIKKEEFEKIDLRRIKSIGRVDVMDDGVEITFIIGD